MQAFIKILASTSTSPDSFILQGGAPKDASTPVIEKENAFPVIEAADTTVNETSIVNESYENSSSWESHDESGQEASETDKYSAIAELDDELEDEKWEERTAVITSTDHQEYLTCAASILQEVLAEVKTPVKA